MNIVLGKKQPKKVSPEPKVSKISSIHDREVLFEECFQLGLRFLADAKEVYVRKHNGFIMITESPLINKSDKYAIVYWGAIERNNVGIKDTLRSTYKHLYLIDLQNRMDAPNSEMLDSDIDLVNQAAELAYGKMLNYGLIGTEVEQNEPEN